MFTLQQMEDKTMMTTQMNGLFCQDSKKAAFFAILQIFSASLLLALCAQISFPLYFNPVPISAQTLGVMFIGATLGSRKGALSVLAYLVEGSLGLPFFAGGHGGLLSLLGPTGGYLIGFILQAYCVGLLIEKQKVVKILNTILILAFSCALQLLIGVVWFSQFIGLETALMMGFYPFLAGELFKVALLTTYLKIKS